MHPGIPKGFPVAGFVEETVYDGIQIAIRPLAPRVLRTDTSPSAYGPGA